MSLSTSCGGDYEISGNERVMLQAQEQRLLCSTKDSAEDMIATNDTLLNVPPPSELQQTPANQTRRFSSRVDAVVTTIQHLYQRGSLSRFAYMKMVFDCSKWRTDSLSLMSSTISGIYGTLLVCTYITFAFTELVLFPRLHNHLEKQGFFIYLFLGSNLYFTYILFLLFKSRKSSRSSASGLLVENSKSHGSVTGYFFLEDRCSPKITERNNAHQTLKWAFLDF